MKVCISDLELVLLNEWGGGKRRNGANTAVITVREGTNLSYVRAVS